MGFSGSVNRTEAEAGMWVFRASPDLQQALTLYFKLLSSEGRASSSLCGRHESGPLDTREGVQ